MTMHRNNYIFKCPCCNWHGRCSMSKRKQYLRGKWFHMSNKLCPPKWQVAGVPEIMLSLSANLQLWPSLSMFVHLTSFTIFFFTFHFIIFIWFHFLINMFFIVIDKNFWNRWYLKRRISKVCINILWLITYTQYQQQQYEVLHKSWWNSSAVA